MSVYAKQHNVIGKHVYTLSTNTMTEMIML